MVKWISGTWSEGSRAVGMFVRQTEDWGCFWLLAERVKSFKESLWAPGSCDNMIHFKNIETKQLAAPLSDSLKLAVNHPVWFLRWPPGLFCSIVWAQKSEGSPLLSLHSRWSNRLCVTRAPKSSSASKVARRALSPDTPREVPRRLIFESSHYETAAHQRNGGLMMWYGAVISGNKGVILTFQHRHVKTTVCCGISAAVGIRNLFWSLVSADSNQTEAHTPTLKYQTEPEWDLYTVAMSGKIIFNAKE